MNDPTNDLPLETLLRAEMLVPAADLIQAKRPKAPVDLRNHGAEWVAQLERANLARDRIVRLFTVILGGIIEAESLPQILDQCGENALLRLSLEKPRETP